MTVVYSFRLLHLLFCLETALLVRLAKPLHWRLAVAGLFVLMLAVAGFSTAMRHLPGIELDRTLSAQGAPGSVPSSAFQSGAARLLATRYFSDVSKLSVLVSRWRDESQWLYGETLVSWLDLPFGERPNMTYDELGRFLGLRVFGSSRGGITPGFVGEMFVNFAWPGIVVGGLLLAFLARLFQRWLPRAGETPLAAIAFCLAMPKLFLLMLNSSFGATMLNLLLELSSIAGIVLLVSAWRRRPGQAAPAGTA